MGYIYFYHNSEEGPAVKASSKGSAGESNSGTREIFWQVKLVFTGPLYWEAFVQSVAFIRQTKACFTSSPLFFVKLSPKVFSGQSSIAG